MILSIKGLLSWLWPSLGKVPQRSMFRIRCLKRCVRASWLGLIACVDLVYDK